MPVATVTSVKAISESIPAWFSLLIFTIFLQACATKELRSIPTVHTVYQANINNKSTKESGSRTIKVLTLNIAHGRGNGLHQLLQSGGKARTHLDAIAEILREQRPDIAALQEADAPSFWSGKIDHVEYLATKGSLSQFVHGNHANGPGLSYGTALISNLELMHLEAITFDPEVSLPAKGFVVATASWPGRTCMQFDIVSIHLDFSSKEVRQQQAEKLIEILRIRNRPAIVMGDFNTTWEKDSSALRLIARELGLLAYKPSLSGQETFARLGHRIDWVLISPEFKFHSYKVIKQKVSDHQPVVAELALNHEAVSTGVQPLCLSR